MSLYEIDFIAWHLAGSNLVARFLIPCVLSYILVPFFRYIAHKTQILDVPNGLLKVHTHPTAYLGGVAIYCAALLSYSLFPVQLFTDQKSWSLYITGMTILMMGGLVDDVLAISPLKKFMIQGVACFFFVYAGLVFKASVLQDLLSFLPGPVLLFSILGVFCAIWWMLAIINALNLIDIMDGLTTIVSLCALWGMCVLWGRYEIFLPFIGVLTGFFFYNKPKASIYLGDAGSLLLGGVLATAPFLFEWKELLQWPSMLAPCCILFIPIFEICSLILIRTYIGIPFYHGSPHHFALWFKRRGWAIPSILRITGALGVIGAFFGIVFASGDISFNNQLLILFSGVAVFVFLCFFGTRSSS